MSTLSGHLTQTLATTQLDDLLRAARDGDQRAFERLLQTFGGRVYQLAYAMLGNRAEAEDIYQEVFLKFLRSLGRLRAGAGLAAWLRKVTLHQCRDHLGRRRRDPAFLETLDDRCDSRDPGQEQRPRRQWLHHHLSSLTARERAAVILVYQVGLSTAECGAALGCSAGTVKALCYRGRQKLKSILATQENRHPGGRS